MSKRIPSLKPSRILRALLRAGFFIHHQTGSQVRIRSAEKNVTLTIARHDRLEFSHVITQRILQKAQISEDEFLRFL